MIRNVYNYFHANYNFHSKSFLFSPGWRPSRRDFSSRGPLVHGSAKIRHRHCSLVAAAMYLTPIDSKARKKGRATGFTLVEVLIATALLGLLAGGALWALIQANNYASIARLYTGAETAAQNQIDVILTEGPFNPQYSPPQIPVCLTLGTSAPQPVTIYTEPSGVNGQTHAVTGQMVTTVAKINVTAKSTLPLDLYSATVVVTYTYRSKIYRVQLNAMRAADV